MTRTRLPIIALALASFALAYGSSTLADDNLPREPAPATTDGHISWHEFRHDLGSYPQIVASMSSDGVVTLSGHADGVEKIRIEKLARRIRGVTKVKSLVLSD